MIKSHNDMTTDKKHVLSSSVSLLMKAETFQEQVQNIGSVPHDFLSHTLQIHTCVLHVDVIKHVSIQTMSCDFTSRHNNMFL